MPKVNYIQASKTNWVGEFDHQFPGIEYVNMGSLQRIADATEKMSKGYQDMRNRIEQLEGDLERYRSWYQEWVQRCNRRDRQIVALKGVITKMKKQKQEPKTENQ